jgi:N-methylhydantoinase B/oxoprolinase/acetone carboxylase alpha subunit
MPPDPWKLLRTDELTDEQATSLEKKLRKRQSQLQAAMAALEEALHQLSSAIDQEGRSGVLKKIRRKKTARKKSKRR